ncbi:sensor histidine kinase [Nocardiopsis composta]|uniref:Signal transduction histidine kinase n=1 Tax=Nocardiopsis composta TaxID=157465 RepID=A0A7W8QI10_9ACTN|nr:histidine kinase [Nocardiopsis composta]MBB5430847.1 signal transduction histidine kinase [Nocardiopsis composta]
MNGDGGGRVEMWAGISMLVVCLLIGAVEGAGVLAAATWPYFAAWLAVFGACLAALMVAAVRATPSSAAGRLLLLAPPVLTASAAVLLSPNRGGMGLILLVVCAALCALRGGLRGMAAVIAWNSAVLAAAASGLGPLVDQAARPSETLVVVLLYGLLQVGTGAMVWSHQRAAEALEALSVAHVELRGASALLAESSQARERLRISRELHDVLGHQLTALALELEIAVHRAEGPAREHVVRARGLAKELLADVRSVVGGERHRSFDLRAALAAVLDGIPRPRAVLEVDPGIDVDDECAVALVRAVQEIATNAIRHSGADELRVRLTADGGNVRLEAWDDGVGAGRIVPGNGLRGLRERVAALGGTVGFDGSDGFRVRAELPAREAVPT